MALPEKNAASFAGNTPLKGQHVAFLRDNATLPAKNAPL